jgi:hypothetical protein
MGWRNYNAATGGGTGLYGNSNVIDAYSANGVSNPTYGTTINPSSTGISIQPNGGNETRPDNYNVNYCIKY